MKFSTTEMSYLYESLKALTKEYESNGHRPPSEIATMIARIEKYCPRSLRAYNERKAWEDQEFFQTRNGVLHTSKDRTTFDHDTEKKPGSDEYIEFGKSTIVHGRDIDKDQSVFCDECFFIDKIEE